MVALSVSLFNTTSSHESPHTHAHHMHMHMHMHVMCNMYVHVACGDVELW